MAYSLLHLVSEIFVIKTVQINHVITTILKVDQKAMKDLFNQIGITITLGCTTTKIKMLSFASLVSKLQKLILSLFSHLFSETHLQKRTYPTGRRLAKSAEDLKNIRHLKPIKKHLHVMRKQQHLMMLET